MKKCAYCAEEIQDEAIKCKHCGEAVKSEVHENKTPDNVLTKQVNVNWKKVLKWSVIIILGLALWEFVLVALPFVGLWYLWKKTKYSKNTKIAISGAIGVLVVIIAVGAMYSSKQDEIDKTIAIQITTPTNNTTTTERTIEIKGSVNLDEASVKVNSQLITIADKDFFYNAELPNGVNTFTVVATKGNYNTTTVLTINRELTEQEKVELAEKQAREEAERKAKEEAEAKTKAEEEQRIKQALSKMRMEVDDIKNITSYEDKSSPQYRNANGFYLKILEAPSVKRFLSLNIQYSGNDWLFINSYIIKADDKTFTLYPDEVNRDNSHYVWEWANFNDSDTFLPIIKAVITSKEAKIRYQGNQYYHDRVITNTEKQALQNVLDALEALKKK